MEELRDTSQSTRPALAPTFIKIILLPVLAKLKHNPMAISAESSFFAEARQVGRIVVKGATQINY